VPPFLNLNILMEAQDDYFVNIFTPLYKTLPIIIFTLERLSFKILIF